MTEYAVTVQYTGDFIVEAESAEEAENHVEHIMGMSTPDSDWYFKEIVGVKEEE
jgi:hypothetical protein